MALTVKKDAKDYPGAGKVVTDMDAEEEEELFEINLEVVNNIPPPHYWESYFTATSSHTHTLLANCLLPIAEVSRAVPIVAKACDHAFSWPAGSFLVVESMPGKLMGFSSFNAFGLQQCDKEKKP